MEKRIVEFTGDVRLLGIEELQRYLSLGRNRAADVGKAAGAVRKIGRRTLYDRVKIDAFIETMA